MTTITKHVRFRFTDLQNTYIVLLISMLIFIITSCDKPESYSDVPEINFINYTLVDKDSDGFKYRSLVLTIGFVDGDGNLSDDSTYNRTPSNGLDTTTYSKIFLKLFNKKSGVYYPFEASELLTPPVFPIPYSDAMKRIGQNKTQKGEMKVEYSFSYVYNRLPYDTIKVEMHITDLSFHKSNVITITDIALNKK